VSWSLPRARAHTRVGLSRGECQHRRSPRPCATPPSRRTASRGSGGTEGPTRGQNKKGSCRTKLHRERRRRWRLGWSRRGSASAISWSLPRKPIEELHCSDLDVAQDLEDLLPPSRRT